MAILKNIATSYGVDATYWTISTFSLDRNNLSISLKLDWYANELAKNPIDSRFFTINFVNSENQISDVSENEIQAQIITPELVELFEKISNSSYELIKKSKEFSDEII